MKVGEKIYYSTYVRGTGYEPVRETEITKVGRKYFKTKLLPNHNIEINLMQSSNPNFFSNDNHIKYFNNPQEFQDFIDKIQLKKEIKNFVNNYQNLENIGVNTLRQIRTLMGIK